VWPWGCPWRSLQADHRSPGQEIPFGPDPLGNAAASCTPRAAVPEGAEAPASYGPPGGWGGFLEHACEQIVGSLVARSDETGLPGGRDGCTGALRPHRQVHPAHGPAPGGEAGDRGDSRAPSFDGSPCMTLGRWPYDSYTAASHQLCCACAAGTSDRSPTWLPRATGAGPPGRRRAHCDATAGQRDDQLRPRHGRPGRAGRSDPRMPLSRHDRGLQDRGPLHRADEKAPRASGRLLDRQDRYLRFTRDFRVAPTPTQPSATSA
jgi:hypothetical protein